VRIGWQVGGWAEGEALARLELEAGFLNCARGVAREVTATGEARPERRVGGALNAGSLTDAG
jgi:hypothetical protein